MLKIIAPSLELCQRAKELGLQQIGWALSWSLAAIGDWEVVTGHVGSLARDKVAAPSPDELIKILEHLKVPFSVIQVNEKVSDQLMRFIIAGLERGANINEVIAEIRK